MKKNEKKRKGPPHSYPKLRWLRYPSVFTANDRTFEDAMHTSLLGSPTPLSSNLVSPDGSAPDLDRVGVRSASPIDERIEAIFARTFSLIWQVWHQFPCLYKGSPDLKAVSCHSHNQRRPSQTKLQTLTKLLIASQLASASA